jgi:uncharacterized damage-inducible protein DinB
MKTLADRFRRWYEYERDCNAKSLVMLNSVPGERRGEPAFQKAIDKMAHLAAARQRWLHRLGHFAEMPVAFPLNKTVVDLPVMIAETESAWTRYLQTLDETELAREFEWVAPDGKRYRWDVEGVLTQVFGHAGYHRGQIAQLVASLDGQARDTDYLYWCNLTPIDEPA